MPLSQQYGFWHLTKQLYGRDAILSQCRSRSNMVSGLQDTAQFEA